MHGKTLVKMIHKNKSGHKLIYCKLTYVNRAFQYPMLIVFTVYSFRSKNDSCLTFKNVENVGATELIKDEIKSL